jgi:hypothetical protein
MKVTLFLLSLILSQQVLADQCVSLFEENRTNPKQAPDIEYLNQEFLKIDPDTHFLLLDDYIQSGDIVYISLNEPTGRSSPHRLSFLGTMLGTIFATGETGHNEMFYYVLIEKTNEIVSFTKHNIDYEKSKLVKSFFGKTIH